MNSEEAKNILQLCRPDHVEDLNDPLITEALEQLERDSTLCAWFEEQQIVDAEISAELCRIMPAPDLKESILKGMQERAELSHNEIKSAPEEEDPSVQPTRPVSTADDNGSKILLFRPWVGIAAAVLFASVLLILSSREPQPNLADANLPDGEWTTDSSAMADGIPDIIQFLGQQIADFNSSKFDKRSEEVNELKAYLALSGMPNPGKIPQQLETAPTIGCVTFDYDGTKMSMICFRNRQVYHLITVNRTDLKKDPLPDHPYSDAKVFEHQKQAFKVWSEGDQIYILSIEGTKEDIPEFI